MEMSPLLKTNTSSEIPCFLEHEVSLPYSKQTSNMLRKNPTKALYILTPLNSHFYAPTCFGPQEATLREYRYIL
jgi:hypothetical protein